MIVRHKKFITVPFIEYDLKLDNLQNVNQGPI